VVGTTLTCAVHSDRFSHSGMPRNFIRNVAWYPVCSKISALLTCTVSSPPGTCSLGQGWGLEALNRSLHDALCATQSSALVLYAVPAVRTEMWGVSRLLASYHSKGGTGPSPSSDNDHHHPAPPLSALCVAFLTPVQAKSTDHVINNY